ncbi:hypothetical protein [Desulfospira joergensenii]|uniref:hypothetical protein n=1 Tax=Desulfospira joergensenii TaxID=53329 RepID=UPI0003B42DB6|nr:hypothetical protein [Desulfospira joergensenii]
MKFRCPVYTCQKVSLLFLFTLLAAVSAGCGNGASKSSDFPDPVQACDLLTKSEVESLINDSVDDPRKTFKEQKNPRHWMSTCNYFSKEKNISIGLMIIPHGRKGSAAEVYTRHEAELKKNLGENYRMEPVAGVGEKAGWDEETKQLTIFQGPYMLLLTGGSPDISVDDALSLNKQLAEKVLAKLPK